jgi:hypothetical protein
MRLPISVCIARFYGKTGAEEKMAVCGRQDPEEERGAKAWQYRVNLSSVRASFNNSLTRERIPHLIRKRMQVYCALL